MKLLFVSPLSQFKLIVELLILFTNVYQILYESSLPLLIGGHSKLELLFHPLDTRGKTNLISLQLLDLIMFGLQIDLQLLELTLQGEVSSRHLLFLSRLNFECILATQSFFFSLKNDLLGLSNLALILQMIVIYQFHLLSKKQKSVLKITQSHNKKYKKTSMHKLPACQHDKFVHMSRCS